MQEQTAHLRDLGLSDKEASVYLAMLELGMGSVQDIARKAEVNRSTAYLLIESLVRRDLASSSLRDGRSLYVAESPQRLSGMVDEAARDLERKRRQLRESMPFFLSLFSSVNERPAVRFFEDEEGYRSVCEVLSADLSLDRVIFQGRQEGVRTRSFAEVFRHLPGLRSKSVRLLLAQDVEFPSFSSRSAGFEYRRLAQAMEPFKGEMALAGNRVAVCIENGVFVGFLAEGEAFARLFRPLFEIAWTTGIPLK